MATTLKTKAKSALILFCSIFCICSCVSDEDYWASDDLLGTWRIAEIEKYNGRCPFHEGDCLRFYSDGGMTIEGYDLYEEGVWEIYNGTLRMDIDDDGYYEIRARIRQHDSGYFVLDTNDEGYGNYTLRLVR